MDCEFKGLNPRAVGQDWVTIVSMQVSDPIVAQSAKAKVTLGTGAEAVRIQFFGIVDEDLNLKPLHEAVARLPAGQKVVFDLSQITRMNSVGVREWILLLERSMPGHVKIEIKAVAQLIVEQANLIPNMLGKKGTPIRSFQAPYFCPTCNLEDTQVLKPEAVLASGVAKAPQRQCKQCGKDLEFDWNEEEYFSFLKR